MNNVWENTLKQLQKDSSYRNMFHMMEQYRDDTAAEMTDREGNEIRRTYREYIRMSFAACGNLQRMGIGDDAHVIGLIYDTCMDWPVLLWGIIMSGNIPLLMNPMSDAKLLSDIMAEARATAYVAAKPVADCDIRYIDAADVLKPGDPGEEKWGQYVALCTSGTTGKSRIFLYDSQTIANHILSFDEAKQIHPDMPFIENKPCKLLAFLPFHHVFGFSVVYLLYSCTGKTLVYLRDKGVQTILKTCQNHGVTHLYCIPLFFNALSDGIVKQLDGKDVHRLSFIVKHIIRKKTLGTKIRSMITGGGHIPESTLDVLNTIGFPLCNGFGMTETGIIAVERSLDASQRIKGSIGVPFTLTEWKLGEDGGDQGEMFLRGNALYSASMVDGQIVLRDKNAWFGTGDVVTKRPDGLYISGRVKDIIIGASGENIYPEELEDNFKNLPGVKNFCLLGVKNGVYEDVSIVVEKAPGFNPADLTSEIRLRNERLSAGERVARLFISAEALPVSGNMKVKRQLLKKRIEDNTWDCEEPVLYKTARATVAAAAVRKAADEASAGAEGAAAMAPAGMEADPKFTEILSEVKKLTAEAMNITIDKIGDREHFIMELGGDSLTVFSIFSALEEKYNITIMDEEMLKLENCYEAARFVYCRVKGIECGFNTEVKAESGTHRITDFSQSEEYISMKQRMKETFTDGINPYFIPHDSLIRDTSVIGGKEVINLGSYNYLGMSGNPETVQAAKDAIDKYGTSASGSRTLAGEKTLYIRLEQAIADWKHTDAAIVGTGGWATNLAFVSCFARRGDFIVYDKLSHNSLIEGVRLSEADSKAFEHNNLTQLEDILRRAEGRYNKVLIIVEGVYSMDGDIAPIPEFVKLKKKYNCFLMVDEAHSGGVLGDHAGGVDDYFHLDPKDIDIKYGTMSKALGTCGGYIAGDASLIEYLRYCMNGFVFTAGIAPPLAAACMKAIEIIQRDNTEVTKLHKNIAYFIRRAKEEGMNTCLAAESGIVPVMIGSDAQAARISAKLLEKGVFVPPAMYPAVPMGESRLRFTISSTHNEQQLEKAVTETAAIMREEGLLS